MEAGYRKNDVGEQEERQSHKSPSGLQRSLHRLLGSDCQISSFCDSFCVCKLNLTAHQLSFLALLRVLASH